MQFKYSALAASLAAALTLSGCGSDSSSSNTNTVTKPDAETAVTQGQFIDAPVQNLYYVTSSGKSGQTNDKGGFNYNEGDSVSFYLGDPAGNDAILLGTVSADKHITPYHLASGSDRTIGLTRLLLAESGDNADLINASAIDLAKAKGIIENGFEDGSLPRVTDYAAKEHLDQSRQKYLSNDEVILNSEEIQKTISYTVRLRSNVNSKSCLTFDNTLNDIYLDTKNGDYLAQGLFPATAEYFIQNGIKMVRGTMNDTHQNSQNLQDNGIASQYNGNFILCGTLVKADQNGDPAFEKAEEMPVTEWFDGVAETGLNACLTTQCKADQLNGFYFNKTHADITQNEYTTAESGNVKTFYDENGQEHKAFELPRYSSVRQEANQYSFIKSANLAIEARSKKAVSSKDAVLLKANSNDSHYSYSLHEANGKQYAAPYYDTANSTQIDFTAINTMPVVDMNGEWTVVSSNTAGIAKGVTVTFDSNTLAAQDFWWAKAEFSKDKKANEATVAQLNSIVRWKDSDDNYWVTQWEYVPAGKAHDKGVLFKTLYPLIDATTTEIDDAKATIRVQYQKKA